MSEGEGLRVYRIREVWQRPRKQEDQKTTQRRREEREGGMREEGRGKGKGTGWAKGLLIRSISEEGPISNIKDESNRSKDDPK